MEITVNDILRKQAICEAKLDRSKTCATCKYRDIHENDLPCSNCINSFMGIPFEPSNWTAKE
jgi:hypothetical protein